MNTTVDHLPGSTPRATLRLPFGGSPMADAPSDQPLKKTPLNQLEHELGGKMVDFGGWELPVQFSGILDEHAAVREHVGLFDVSHMGELTVKGPDALALLQTATCNDVSKLDDGR